MTIEGERNNLIKFFCSLELFFAGLKVEGVKLDKEMVISKRFNNLDKFFPEDYKNILKVG